MKRRDLIKVLGGGVCAAGTSSLLGRNPALAAATPDRASNGEGHAAANGATFQKVGIASAARAVLTRQIGARAKEFDLDSTAAQDGHMVYELAASGGTVLIKGSSAVAICRGAYTYLRQACQSMVTWSGQHLALPARFPDYAPQRVVCPYQFVQYYNVCTFGYSTPFWNWERWERELDWMALHGVTMALALDGQEAIWQRVWTAMGLTQPELDRFSTGPAHLPWHRMGNINYFDGPLPQSWIDQKRELQKKILGRMRELGISPVVPTFSGYVPQGFKRVHPEARTFTLLWSPEYQRSIPLQTATFFLDPRESALFKEVARRFIQEYKEEYGVGEYYLADPFNEMRVGLAYAVTPKVVVRSGFVIFDDHNQFDKQVQGSRGSWPFGIPSGAEALFTALNRGVPTVFANALPSAASLLAGSTPYPSVADDIRQKIAYSLEYNLGVEYQITSNTALTVNYVGSETRHVWACCYTYNQPYPNELGPNSFPDALPFPFLNATLAGESNSINGDYNGLQLKLEKRFAKGLSILASYTWSKSLDMQSGDYNSSPQNTYNMQAEWGPSDYNFPQLFSFAAVYQLPVGQGQRFAGNASRALNAIIGGWNVSDITSAHSGSPFTVDVPYDNANAGTTQRANVVPGCPLTPSGFQQNVQHWYNTACFVVPPQYTFGDLGRNTLRGPNSLNFDFSLFKDFKLTESKTLEFRAESFNIFNAVNLAPPGGGVTGAYTALGGSSGTDVATPTFMQIYSAAPGREIQFALKFIF